MCYVHNLLLPLMVIKHNLLAVPSLPAYAAACTADAAPARCSSSVISARAPVHLQPHTGNSRPLLVPHGPSSPGMPLLLHLPVQMVANVPRIATKAINTCGAPHVPAGCPFSASWCGESVLDPAVRGSQTTFNPERWLDPKNKDSLKLHQHPFGYGTHSCLGWRIAKAVAAAMAQELALVYDFSADTNTAFDDFPTGSRPVNELPLSLKPLPKAA